jgi:hypothetical protein
MWVAFGRGISAAAMEAASLGVPAGVVFPVLTVGLALIDNLILLITASPSTQRV